MLFKYVGEIVIDEDGEEIKVNGYSGSKVSNGDTVELNRHFSNKALSDPNYELVKDDDNKSAKKSRSKTNKTTVKNTKEPVEPVVLEQEEYLSIADDELSVGNEWDDAMTVEGNENGIGSSISE